MDDKQKYSATVKGREYYGSNKCSTIDVQEAIIVKLIEWGIEPDVAFDIATGCKYVSRAGSKPEESAESDIGKAATYFYRGLKNKWPM